MEIIKGNISIVKQLMIISFIILTNFSFGQKNNVKNPWNLNIDNKLTKFSTKWENKNKPIDVWAKHIEYGFINYGVLYGVTDTSIKIAKHKDLMYSRTHAQNKDVNFLDIEYLLLREPNRKRKHIFMGIPIGLAVGLAIVAIINPRGSFTTSKAEYFVAGGAIGGATGFISGMFIGSMKLKLPLNGSKDNFEKSKDRIRAISINK